MNSAVHVSQNIFNHTVLYVIHNVLNSIEFEAERQHLIEFQQENLNIQAYSGATIRDGKG